jgi:hypothetical protein
MTSNASQEDHVSCEKFDWQLAVALYMPEGDVEKSNCN